MFTEEQNISRYRKDVRELVHGTIQDDGLLTDESAEVVVNTKEFVNKLVLAK